MHNKNKQIDNLTTLNEELENYFANTIIPQLFVDKNLILRKFTPPAMSQFKLRAEHVGVPLEEIKENFRFPTIIDNINIVIATGKILEKEIQTTDLRWFQMNILPYRVRKDNATNGVIITFVDITPRIRDLKEQEKLIAEHELLLDTIAHDIKNPLLGLGLTIELMKKLPEKSMEKFPVLLENVETSLINMKKVISDLIDCRWHKQKYEATEEIIDFQNILEDVRLTLAPQILETGAVIKVDLQISEITFVRRKLRSVLVNLLSNAIKYTPADQSPEISLRTYKEKNYFVISVSDNGIGLTDESKKSVFEKFNRVGVSVEGSGVGLYLVHTIVTASGGKITLDNKPEGGSIFKVYLKL
ncbi:ATP-binding protein [Pedobacter gandavensis]|uniref:sensor histidine kinase n=1 Tax=Pedobacter gandavensis TaxID=2679963 RepID=UPI00292F61BE|nr:ATP-binding protein [Pedobacter gandavensis]